MVDKKPLICDFGLHKGEPYTRVPASFLTWMIGANHKKSHIAVQELKRRELAATNQIHIALNEIDK
jgi:spore germination protein GerM